jgi:3-dehydroquinate dehydratase
MHAVIIELLSGTNYNEVGLRDTEIWSHDTYRQKVSRYRVYRDTIYGCGIRHFLTVARPGATW